MPNKSNMAQTIRHSLAQSPKTNAKNWAILRMSVKQPDCIKAQVSGYLFKSVMRVLKTDQLPLHRGIRSRALPFCL